MRQRLGLAAALLRQPELLMLDEPTNGLDPQGIGEIRQLLLALHAAGTTIFLSSHLLAEVEQLCSRVGVLDRGRLVVQSELAALQTPTGRIVLHTPDPALAVSLLDGRVEHRDARPAAGARRRPGRAERAAGRPGRPGHRAAGAAAHPGGLGAGADRSEHRPGGAADDRDRDLQAVPPAAHLADHRAAGRAAHRGGDPAGDHPSRPAAGPGTGLPVGGAEQRLAVLGRRAGHRAAAVPADRGRGGGR